MDQSLGDPEAHLLLGTLRLDSAMTKDWARDPAWLSCNLYVCLLSLSFLACDQPLIARIYLVVVRT